MPAMLEKIMILYLFRLFTARVHRTRAKCLILSVPVPTESEVSATWEVYNTPGRDQ